MFNNINDPFEKQISYAESLEKKFPRVASQIYIDCMIYYLFEEVDKKLLADYALVKSNERNVDEVDFYRAFIFGADLQSKEQRVFQFNKQSLIPT